MERPYPIFKVTKKAELSLKNGHPWVYGDEVTGVTKEYRNGDIVDVRGPKDNYLGSGYVNDNSKIRVRVISDNANDRFDEDFYISDNCRVVKDNMFPVPPLFHAIHECSGTDWKEMYQVFNMGHRMEIYVRPEVAEQVVSISRSFNIDAQVVGHIEEGKKSLTIKSEFGEFNY